MEIDQNRILSTAKLRLSGDLKHGDLPAPYRVLKNTLSCRYLTVDHDQWRILLKFREPRAVEDVLPELIEDRICPNLQEFYELILKAVAENVLVSVDAPPPEPVPAVDWKYGVKWELAQMFGVGAISFTAFAFGVTGLQLPEAPWQWLLLWPVMFVAESIGYFLAAGAIAVRGCQVYRPGIRFAKLFPSYTVDTVDCRMGGRTCELAVALCRLFPIIMAAGIANFAYPPLEAPLLLALLYFTNPFGKNPAMRILMSALRKPRCSTEHDQSFLHGRALHLFASGIAPRRESFSFVLTHWLHALFWLFLVLVMAVHLMDAQLLNLVGYAETVGWPTIVAMSVLLLGVLPIVPTLRRLLQLAVLNHERNTAESKVLGAPVSYKGFNAGKLGEQDIAVLLKHSLLFMERSDATIARVAAQCKPVSVARGAFIAKAGEVGDRMYIIYSGAVDVLRSRGKGRPLKVCTLSPTEVFGETPLVRNIPHECSYRASKQTMLLEVDRDCYTDVIVPAIGREIMAAIIQKLAFLYRIELCRQWPMRTLKDFASRAVIRDFRKGECVVQSGNTNQYFYIVYEGAFDVRFGKKRLARLTVGEFFGEVSLLRSSIPMPEVVAAEDGRVMALNRHDFLRAIASDYFIALQIERLASERLHKPVFPLKGEIHEALRAV